MAKVHILARSLKTLNKMEKVAQKGDHDFDYDEGDDDELKAGRVLVVELVA